MINSKVTFKSLGGLRAIGSRNCACIIHNGLVYMHDCGFQVPDDDPNREITDEDERVDSFMDLDAGNYPNFDPIFEGEKLEVGSVFASHGHLDHIGGLKRFFHEYSYYAWFNNKVMPKVLASKYTERAIHKLLDSRLVSENTLVVTPDLPVREREADFKFFPVIHSMPGSTGATITVGGKTIAYLGDIKRYGKVDETESQRNKLSNLHCDALLLDSTGVEREGSTPPDHEAALEVIKLVSQCKGRVFITFFASNMERYVSIIKFLEQYQSSRQVVVSGRSLMKHLSIARIRGWTPYNRELEVNDNAVFFLTGSQGELFSGTYRLSSDELSGVKLRDKDTVIFSSSVIPDKRDNVRQIVDKLSQRCAVYISDENLYNAYFAHNPQVFYGMYHASGHASRDDLREIVELVDPGLVIPVHAGREHRELFVDLFPNRQIVLLDELEEFDL